MIARAKGQLVPAVAYLRMSTDKQDKSIADQRGEVLRYAERNGYKIVREYVDEGESGCKESRKGFQQLVSDASTVRDFDALLCWNQERFSRMDILDTAAYWKALRDADVALVTCVEGRISFDNIQGILLACINQHAASDYPKKCADNLAKHQRSAASKGFWVCSRPPYGYRSEGPKGEKRLVPHEDEARFVRIAFELYVESGLTCNEIARRLRQHGQTTAEGNDWTGKTVRGMLRNEAYTGTIVFGKRAVGKHTRSLAGEGVQMKRQDARPTYQRRGDCIVSENAHAPIISARLFRLAQEKLADNITRSTKPRAKCTALSGLLTCGHCGGKLGVRRRPGRASQLICVSRNCEHGCKPECRYALNYDRVAELLMGKVQRSLLSDAQIESHRQAMVDFMLSSRSKKNATATTLRKTVADAEAAIAKAERRVLSAPDDMLPMLYSQIRELRERLDSARSSLTAQTRVAAVSEKAVAEDAKALVAALRQAREDLASIDPAVARQTLARLLDRAVVYARPVSPGERSSPSQKLTLDRVDVACRSDGLMLLLDCTVTNTAHLEHWILSVKSGLCRIRP
jgi:site-specific DNA recombinase